MIRAEHEEETKNEKILREFMHEGSG